MKFWRSLTVFVVLLVCWITYFVSADWWSGLVLTGKMGWPPVIWPVLWWALYVPMLTFIEHPGAVMFSALFVLLALGKDMDMKHR